MTRWPALFQVGLPDWRVLLPSQVRAFVFGPLLAGLMLAAASPATHAQTLDTVVGEQVAAVARQTSAAP